MSDTPTVERQYGQGNPYPRSMKLRARELWAAGDYATDDDVAEAIGIVAVRGGNTVADWRKASEPDGVDWYEFRSQVVLQATEQATAKLASQYADKQVRFVGQLTALTDNLFGACIHILNRDLFGPIQRNEEPKFTIDGPTELKRYLECVKLLDGMVQDVATPKARRLIDPEQVAALAERMTESLLKEGDGHSVGIAMVAWSEAVLSALPVSGGNGDGRGEAGGEIVATHEAPETEEGE